MIPWYDLKMEFRDGQPYSGEIVFSHVDDATGETRIFAVERIAKHVAIHGAKRITVPINPAFAMYLPRHRGLEKHRLARITPQDLIDYPILLAHMPGIAHDHDEHLVVDGSHRYFFAFTLGWKEMPGFEVPKEVWEQYLVDVPQEVLDMERENLRGQCEEGKPINSHIR